MAHLLGAILGFSNDEFRKIEHGAGSGGWLQFLRLGGDQSSSPHGKSAEQSIAAQFVKFLENESTPRSPAVPMLVPDQRSTTPGFSIGTPAIVENRTGPTTTSRSSTPGLNLELPTFASSSLAGGAPTTTGMSFGSGGGSSDFLRDLLSKSSNDNVI